MGGGGGDMKFSSFLKGGTEKFSDVCWREQFIFRNLNPIVISKVLSKFDFVVVQIEN